MKPHFEAGHTTALDHMLMTEKISLASVGRPHKARIKSPGRERYGKGAARRQVGDRKANNRELPFKCRKCSDDVETGE